MVIAAGKQAIACAAPDGFAMVAGGTAPIAAHGAELTRRRHSLRAAGVSCSSRWGMW